MTDPISEPGLGLQFDRLAERYDRHRPTYPDELVDATCEAAGVGPGDHVLEIGCGTGQLTAALVARGLRVTAVDPGPRMIERARSRAGDGAVEFVCGRFEDVTLPEARFPAVFSATAFHWVDPAVSWRKAATMLEPGGGLVLITYCSGADPDSIEIEQALFDDLREVAPDIAANVPPPRKASEVLDGLERRRANVSELWSWIGQHALTVPEAASLFDDVRVLSRAVPFDWTAERLNAHRRTTSLSLRLGSERTAALEAATDRRLASYGGQIRLPMLVVGVVARRAGST